MVQSDFPRKFTFRKIEREMCLESLISAFGTEGLQQVQGQKGFPQLQASMGYKGEGFGEGREDD